MICQSLKKNLLNTYIKLFRSTANLQKILFKKKEILYFFKKLINVLLYKNYFSIKQKPFSPSFKCKSIVLQIFKKRNFNYWGRTPQPPLNEGEKETGWGEKNAKKVKKTCIVITKYLSLW